MSPPRVLLCLVLFASSLGLAQTPGDAPPPSPPPPLVPAPTQAEEAPPAGEILPRTYKPVSPESRGTTIGRVLLEFAGGTIVGAGMGIASTLLLFELLKGGDGCGGEEAQCVLGALILSAPITAVGMTLGVYFAGGLLNGNGGFLASLGGMAVGLGAGTLLTVASQGLLVIPAILLPLIGAIVGYELSHSSTANRSDVSGAESASAGLQLIPLLGTTPRGGVFGGLSARF